MRAAWLAYLFLSFGDILVVPYGRGPAGFPFLEDALSPHPYENRAR